MTGVDVAPEMLAQAREQGAGAGLAVTYRLAAAEDTALPAHVWDVVSAGQCWHWFDRPRVAAEARRLLVEDGALAICYRDYVTTPGSVAAASEELVLAHHPGWPLAKGIDNHPGAVPEALLAIEQASQEAMDELRATLEVLRTDDTLAGDGLVEGARKAGVPVTVAVTGSPCPLPVPVQRAMTKLRARDRAQLVVLAYETGLVSPAATT